MCDSVTNGNNNGAKISAMRYGGAIVGLPCGGETARLCQYKSDLLRVVSLQQLADPLCRGLAPPRVRLTGGRINERHRQFKGDLRRVVLR